jgi:hypothetical protein
MQNTLMHSVAELLTPNFQEFYKNGQTSRSIPARGEIPASVTNYGIKYRELHVISILKT